MQPESQFAFAGLSELLLAWIASSVGPGARILSARLMEGATSSSLYSIMAQYKRRNLRLVLRRYTNREWLLEEESVPAHEAAALQKVWTAGVSTPELIAVDPVGALDGIPALLMTQLSGKVVLKPADFNSWLFQQVEILQPIHDIEPGSFPWNYSPYNRLDTLAIPIWTNIPKLWERAIEIVNGPGPWAPQCFIHRDYHPVNVLWHANQISGLVDWPNACRGPGCIDVSWCRANLAYMYGVDMADQFLHAYQVVTGSSCDYHPFWDLMVIIEILPGPPDVYPPWKVFGLAHLTNPLMLERADAYLASVLARL